MPATEVTHFLFEAKPLWTGQIGASGVADGTVQTIPLQSASNLDSGDVYVVRINRVDSNGTKTTSPSTNTEVLYGKLSGTNLTESIRGAEGTAQAWAAGTVVEVLFTAVHWNKMIEFLEVEHNAAGTHKETALDSMIAGTEAQGDIIYHNGTIWTRLAKGTDGNVLKLASNVPAWGVTTSRVVTTTDDATAVIDVDTTDQYQLSAVANATTFTVTGTPTDGQRLIIRFKDAGVAKGLTFTGFTAMGATIPTTTTAGKWGYVGCIYNSAATTWHVVVAQTEA